MLRTHRWYIIFLWLILGVVLSQNAHSLLINACGTNVNESSTLIADISAAGTCLTITNSSVNLDCNGFTITYNTGGGDAVSGIVAVDKTNLVVSNCTILDATSAGQLTEAINFTNVNNSIITNHNITTNGTGVTHGIHVAGDSNEIQITRNSLSVWPGGGSPTGIGVVFSSAGDPSDILVERNTIDAVIFSGISFSSVSNGTIRRNTIIIRNGTSTHQGIVLSGSGGASISTNITIEQNSLFNNVTGTGTANGFVLFAINNSVIRDNNITIALNRSGTGIRLGTSAGVNTESVNITGNFLNLSKTGPFILNGLWFTGGGGTALSDIRVVNNSVLINPPSSPNVTAIHTNNTNSTSLLFINNTVTALASDAVGLDIAVSLAINGTRDQLQFINLTLNGTTKWIVTSVNVTQFSNFTNTTFMMPNGSILFLNFSINATNESNQSNANMSFNSAFVNSTELPYLNTSAFITLDNLNFADPKARVDFEDDGTFIDCDATNCTEVSYNGSTFVFNVSHFTFFAAAENATACGETIMNDTVLTVNVSSAGNCFVLQGANFTFDCQGNIITWDTGGTGSDAIVAENITNVTVRNCIIRDGSAGGSGGVGINWSNANTSFIINNTITNNGTSSNFGLLINESANISVANNTITTNLSSSNGATISFVSNVLSNITGNSLFSGGSSSPDGISLAASPFTRIVGNQINVTGTSSAVRGIDVNAAGSFDFVAINNSIIINATSAGLVQGLVIASYNHTILLNNVTGYSESTDNSGLIFTETRNTTVADNIFVINGTSTNEIISGTVNNSIIANNTLILNGTAATNLAVTIDARNVSIHNNTINVSAGSLGRGIDLLTSTNGTNATQNTIFVVGGSGLAAIQAVTSTNLVIRDNFLFTNSTDGVSVALRLVTAVTNSLFINNTLITNGTTNVHGILLSSNDNAFFNNTITSTGSDGAIRLSTALRNNFTNTTIFTNASSSHGIEFLTSARNNTFNITNIRTAGATSFGVRAAGSANNTFIDTILNDTTEWILSTAANSDNNFTNTTFLTNNGSIFFEPRFTVNNSIDINRTTLNISSNLSFVNSTNLSFLNLSAQITLNGIPFADPKPIVDFEDDGTFIDCDSTNCTEISFAGGVYIFNVTHFTKFAAQDNVTQCPGIIMADTNITENVTASGNCVTIRANNTELNCLGNTIFWDSSGIGADAIVAENVSNVSVQNCIMADINAAGVSGVGINFTRTNTSNITNNTIQTNGTTNNYGILLFASSHNRAEQNTIRTLGSSNNYGVYADNTPNRNNTIRNNTIITNGTAGSNSGILFDGGENHTISFNTITTNGTSSNNGIDLSDGTNGADSVIANNTILTRGTSQSNFGIVATDTSRTNITDNIITATGTAFSIGIDLAQLSFNALVRNNNITTIDTSSGGGDGINIAGLSGLGGDSNGHVLIGNIIRTNGTTGAGVDISQTNGFVNLTNNTITTTGAQSFGISIATSSEDTEQDITYTIINSTATWILFDKSVGQSILTNLANTTFLDADGAINFNGSISIDESLDVNQTYLNITPNRAFLNSTNLTVLNQSARITLENVAGPNPQPIVDFDGNGVFEFCPPDICTIISFNGSTFIFDTAHFTTYSSTFGGVTLNISKTDSPDPVAAGSVLTYQINITVLNGTAFNGTVTETYPAEVTFNNSSPAPDAGSNTTFTIGNLTINQTYQINITVNVTNSTAFNLINNTISYAFENSTGYFFVVNVTESTNVTSGRPVVSVVKTDSPDPVSPGSQLTYTITVTGVSDTAVNVTVNDTIPSGVTFDSSNPAPTVANVSWVDGNLSPGETFQINITVNVSANATGTLTNIVNVTFENTTGGFFSTSTTAETTVSSGGGGGGGAGGGGGGGGGVGSGPVTLPPCPSICSDSRYSGLPTCSRCANPTPVQQPACIEEWSCGAWTDCKDGMQYRFCTDLNSCGTTNNRQPTQQSCVEEHKAQNVASTEAQAADSEETTVIEAVEKTTASTMKFLAPILAGIAVLIAVFVLALIPRKPKEPLEKITF